MIESGTTTIKRSTIANNDSSSYAQSGIIIRSDATVDIANSTIANNKARSNSGIENAGTVNITNSTIAYNSGGLGAGGIKNFDSGTVTLTSSLLANNTGGPNVGDISGDGEFISGGNNLISNGDDATGFVDGVNGDIVGSNGDDPSNPQTDLLIDARLGELQDNGGSTQTLALLDGSPAIDAGSNPNNLENRPKGRRVRSHCRQRVQTSGLLKFKISNQNSMAIAWKVLMVMTASKVQIEMRRSLVLRDTIP